MRPAVRPMRILFADDETSIQELMRIELPRLGHEATVCPDGRTALAALDRTSYDCVIVDLDMPGVGGLEVIERVRETSADTETVIITGKSSLESAVMAVRQGVFDYLTKPCKLAEIQAVLERVRKKRELTSRLRALERRVRRAEGTSQLVGASAGLECVRHACRQKAHARQLLVADHLAGAKLHLPVEIIANLFESLRHVVERGSQLCHLVARIELQTEGEIARRHAT